MQIEVPCERIDYAAGFVGDEIPLRLGGSTQEYQAVVLATLPSRQRLLVELPDDYIRIHPIHTLGRGTDV